MGTFGGLSVTGLYSFNYNNQEVPGNLTNGREYSLGANYSGGSFSIGAVYDQINQSAATALQTNSLTQRAAVAGTYAYGNAKFYAGYRYAHAFNGASLPGSTAANTASNLAWAGVGYQVTPALIHWLGLLPEPSQLPIRQPMAVRHGGRLCAVEAYRPIYGSIVCA
jgi:predicted porin